MTLFDLRTGMFLTVLLGTTVATDTAFAFNLPPNDGLVTVQVDSGVVVLTKEERDTLAEKLTAYDQTTSNQIAIVILQSLQGEPIADVALQFGRAWGVGSTKDNGILILFSYEDRQVRIEVGYGLEGAVPDLVASGIIEKDMIPHFSEGKYAAGFEEAVTSLEKHIGGEYTPDRYAKTDGGGSFYPLLFFFIFLQWVLAILGRTKSWWLGGVFGGITGLGSAILYGWWLAIPLLIPVGLLLDFLVSRNYGQRGSTKWWAGGGWGPGGGFGSGRGGGFGGFGGGGFGGGGASGHW
jgi:uncharacterized protein